MSATSSYWTSDGSCRPLREVATASSADANRVFGEPLPHGLRLDLHEAQETL